MSDTASTAKTSTTLPFRTDVEVLSGPVYSGEGLLQPVARLIDRDGVTALEVTLLTVPKGTKLLEYQVNGRVQSGGTYVPGSVTAMRVEPDTPIDLVVIAMDDTDTEIGRSTAQHIERSGSATGS